MTDSYLGPPVGPSGKLQKDHSYEEFMVWMSVKNTVEIPTMDRGHKNETLPRNVRGFHFWRPLANALRTFSFEGQTIRTSQDSSDYGFVQP
jgi:hypothetical protein